MKQFRKPLAWALCLCLLLGLCPGALTAEAAEPAAVSAASVVLTGNTGATLTFAAAPLSAAVDDNELAIVELRDTQVRVLALEGAVGTVRLTVETAAGVYEVYDIPLGYTTFAFDGDRLTVCEGSSTAYEISGINAAGEEYLVGDAGHPLPYTTDAEGNRVYENTETYKLCVSVKKTGGAFVFTGTGADGSIAVKKQATGPALLLLAGLNLSSSFTAPLTVKKDSTSTVTVTALAGWTSTLADAAFNNADLYGPVEEGGDGSNAACAESAVIKGKTAARLTLNGGGTLNLICATKNAVKVGVSGSLTLDELTLNVTAAHNGLSSDNLLTIDGGRISVTTADGDCIRTDPDAVDAAAGCAGCIVINGGVLNLQSSDDGIQAAQDLTVNGGELHIKTRNGYNSSGFNSSTMSCKGLKASFNTDDSTEQEDAANTITINGGSFDLNTVDDAIHSDGYVVITGGEFTIQTGDDGVHADNQADFGVQGAADCAIHLTVSNSYEGLEAKNVYIRSGCYDVTASDDGINAAGGSSSGSDPGPWNPWNPGGGGGDYDLTISGGKVYVNAGGDGLDSNGRETLTGGSIIVWGASSSGQGSDNSPLDCDGALTINGATVFAAGSRQMQGNPGSGSQPYVRFGSSGGGPGGGGGGSSISANSTIVVKNASSQVVFAIKAIKTINFALYSAPTMTSSSGWSIASGSSSNLTSKFWTDHSYGSYAQTAAPSCTEAGVQTAVCACGDAVTLSIPALGHDWSAVTVEPTPTAEGYDLYTCARCGGRFRTNFTDPTGEPDPCADGHTWDAGTVTGEPSCTEAGELTYTCTVCGETSTAAIAALGHSFDESTGLCVRCGTAAFTATFVCSEGVSVTAYPSQDLTAGGTAQAETVFVRSADGAIDVSGSGQVNFVVVLDEGYSLENLSVTPTASFKNLKGPDELGVENAYRVTKVTGNLTVTVTASADVCQHEFDDEGFCVHCGLEAPRAIFLCGEHVTVTVWPTQDLTAPGAENAAVGVARNGATGEIDLSGGGQVNFMLVPEEGYVVESLTAEPASAYKNLKGPDELGVGNAYRLTKVSGTVTVTVTAAAAGGSEWTPCDGENCPGAAAFSDMPEKSHWAHDAIDWAYTRGITAGVSEGVFGLKMTCTRAQVVTFLWAAAGKPEPAASENPFVDVAETSWYCQAVLWAVEQGITNGRDATHFAPGAACTRAEVVTFLWAAAGRPAAEDVSNPFLDVREGSWYRTPVLWAYSSGVTAGTSAAAFSPGKSCTRAEIVTFLFRAFTD